jgi:hypothetical protein
MTKLADAEKRSCSSESLRSSRPRAVTSRER